jgi:hypothetical protein
MEQDLHSSNGYDYRQYDRVWQRVAPNLEPYPGIREAAVPAMAELPGQPQAQPVQGTPPSAALTAEEQLPGAQANPCCMGSAAMEMLEVIEGFIEEELADRRYDLAFARQAPSWARQKLRDLAAAAGGRAKRLMAVYYLITGQCYQASINCERIFVSQWCSALRERYHVEACNGLNYLRAADGTTDPCLTRLLNQLGEESYRDADQLMALLERAL